MSNNQLLNSQLKFKANKDKSLKKRIGEGKKYPTFVIWFTWILIIAFAATSIYFGFMTGQQSSNAEEPQANREKNEQVDLTFMQGEADKNPTDAVKQAEYAQVLQKNGKLGQAEAYFKKALEVDPGYLFAAVSLSRLYNQQKQYAKAVELLKKAINDPKNQDKNQEASLELGVTYFLEGNDKAALGMINPIIAKDPSYFRAYKVRGEVYLKENKLKAAEADLNTAAEICRNTGDLAGAQSSSARIGIYYFEKGNLKAADKEVDKMLTQDIYNPQAYALRIQIYLTQGKKEEARKLLDKGLEAAQQSRDVNTFVQLMQLQKALEPASQVQPPAGGPQTGATPTAPGTPISGKPVETVIPTTPVAPAGEPKTTTK